MDGGHKSLYGRDLYCRQRALRERDIVLLMRFWFMHSGEVSLHEQLCTQVTLAIASGELKPGQRLPSTREMARRYDLHANTVSSAYQRLQQEGALERRHGAGVFVRQQTMSENCAGEGIRALDRMIAQFLTAARVHGFAREQVVTRVKRWLEVRPPDHFLLVEPEEERQEIVLAELRGAVQLPVRACSFEDCREVQGAIAIALPSKAAKARDMLPASVELITLQVTSVPAEMREWLPVPPTALVGLVSRWPEFLQIARTVLVAAGFDADSLVMRVRGEEGWTDGLDVAAAVVCDAATAQYLPEKARAVVFRLVSEASLTHLRALEAEISASLSASG